MAAPTISISLSTMPAAPTVSQLGTQAFDDAAFPFVAAWETVYNEINSLSGEVNTLATWMNTTAGEVDTAKTAAEAAQAAAEAARDLAQLSGNYLGDWSGTYNSGLGYALGDSVSHNTIIYISKISSNTDTPPSTNWQEADSRELDSIVREFEITGMTYDGSNNLTNITYSTGNKVNFTYGAVEQITNGTFTTDVTGWATTGNSTVTHDTGKMKVTCTDASGIADGEGAQTIDVLNGHTYTISWEGFSTGDTISAKVTCATDVYTSATYTADTGVVTATFTADSTSATIKMVVDSTDGTQVGHFDNISVVDNGAGTNDLSKAEYTLTDGTTVALDINYWYSNGNLVQTTRTKY